MAPAAALERLCSNDPREEPPRTLLVVAHPDDDVVGAGERLPRLARHVHVVFATDGAPRNPYFHEHAGFATRDAYRDARRREARAALGAAGIGEDRIHELRIADQGASLALVDLARRIAELIERLTPDVVLTHAYEGGHPDHDAVAFGAHAARLVPGAARFPEIFELACYHLHDETLVTHAFLPNSASSPRILPLTPEQRALKQRMLDCHSSQRSVLEAFSTEHEAFRCAPRYDFTRLPAPALHYDRYDWGMRGERFVDLASKALQELRPCEPSGS